MWTIVQRGRTDDDQTQEQLELRQGCSRTADCIGTFQWESYTLVSRVENRSERRRYYWYHGIRERMATWLQIETLCIPRWTWGYLDFYSEKVFTRFLCNILDSESHVSCHLLARRHLNSLPLLKSMTLCIKRKWKESKCLSHLVSKVDKTVTNLEQMGLVP